MKIAKNAPRKEFMLQGIRVSVGQPFAEGHVCSVQEAGVLNQTLVENLRNNLAKEVGELKEKLTAEGADEAAITAAVQAKLDAYVPDYEFGLSRGSSADPVETEARSIARKLLSDAIKSAGGKIKDYTDAKATNGDGSRMDEMVAEALATHGEEIYKQAKEVVAARQKRPSIKLALPA